MGELANNVIRTSIYTVLLIVVYSLGWLFTPYAEFFTGLVLGTVFSLLNIFIMYRRVNRIGQAALTEKKIYSAGSFTRYASAALAILIALSFPEAFNLVGVIMGLLTAYIIIFIDSFIQHLRS